MFSNPLSSNKIQVFKLKSTNLTSDYFFLMFGFFGGNLFSFIFSILPIPPLFLILGVVLSFEIASFVYYSSSLCSPLKRQSNVTLSFLRLKKRKLLFLVKLGLLFGLFVDAFKVGS